jgi:hypothetical protein
MNLYDRIINHPGRRRNLQFINHHCAAATPPSKGGETFSIPYCYNTMIRLTAMWEEVSACIQKTGNKSYTVVLLFKTDTHNN